MLAEIEKRINEGNARPKKRYISPATRKEEYAVYYDELRRKIEQKGTTNFPQQDGKKLYGELTMVLTVNANGQVLDADHGYPCRLIAPTRPGVLQTKWLSRIEVIR